jgi:hypothetical protein
MRSCNRGEAEYIAYTTFLFYFHTWSPINRGDPTLDMRHLLQWQFTHLLVRGIPAIIPRQLWHYCRSKQFGACCPRLNDQRIAIDSRWWKCCVWSRVTFFQMKKHSRLAVLVCLKIGKCDVCSWGELCPNGSRYSRLSLTTGNAEPTHCLTSRPQWPIVLPTRDKKGRNQDTTAVSLSFRLLLPLFHQISLWIVAWWCQFRLHVLNDWCVCPSQTRRITNNGIGTSVTIETIVKQLIRLSFPRHDMLNPVTSPISWLDLHHAPSGGSLSGTEFIDDQQPRRTVRTCCSQSLTSVVVISDWNAPFDDTIKQ